MTKELRGALGLDLVESKKHSLANSIHTWLLVGGSLLLLGICAFVFMGVEGVVYAVVFGAISLFAASRVSPSLVLKMYKAQPVSRAQFPAGHAILDQLVQRAELKTRPGLFIVPSKMMNAFAVGRINESAIAMTDQLVRNLTQRELAGVMAHEVAHIKNEDIRVMAVADMVSRFTSLMSTFGMFALFINLPSLLFGGGANIPWLAVAILMASPTIGGLLQMALSRAREFDADLGAALYTGDPDGLAMALQKLEKIQKRKWEGMVLPGPRMPEPSMLRTHPKTEDRVARLMALKQTHGDQPSGTEMPVAKKKAARKSASVPTIKPKWGRGEAQKYARYANLMTDDENASDLTAEPDQPAAHGPLNEPEGKPRIRIEKGGVWW